MISIKLQTNKVGIVPYRLNEQGVVEFLVHLPKPKTANEEVNMKWGLARGTVTYAQNADHDIRLMGDLVGLLPEQIEDHWQTALREAKEELGITQHDIMPESISDHSLIEYRSENKPPYPVHFFALQLNGDVSVTTMNERVRDAQQVAWRSLDELEEMVVAVASPNEQFKAGYIAVLKEIMAQGLKVAIEK